MNFFRLLQPEIEQIREVLGYDCDSASVEEALQISGGDIHQAINLLLDKTEDFVFKPVDTVATHFESIVDDAVLPCPVCASMMWRLLCHVICRIF